MYCSVHDLKEFYNSKLGCVVQRVLQERIGEFWPDLHGLRIVGIGYAIPYLLGISTDSERVISMMPALQGVHAWPQEGKNLVCMSEEGELPLETNSVDRVLLIHNLEFAELIKPNLQEVWRILKSNGRLLVVVPNRTGLWTRADWSPFGQGTPYSASQLEYYLYDNLFVHERTEEALFMPPARFSLALKSADIFERIGRKISPFIAGVHMVEVSKQLYAMPRNGEGSKIHARDRVFVPKPVPQNYKT